MEGFGSRTYDPNGLLNVKLSNCTWMNVRAPVMKTVDVPLFMLNEPEEVEGFFGEAVGSSAGVRELTGIFKRSACVAAQGDMAVESSEVVCLCYRVKCEKEKEIVKVETSSVDNPQSNDAYLNSGSCINSTESNNSGNSNSLLPPTSPPMVDLIPIQPKDTVIEGYLDWCERGSRSRFNGTISPTGTSTSTVDGCCRNSLY